jgi:hypothetical protein
VFMKRTGAGSPGSTGAGVSLVTRKYYNGCLGSTH